MIKMTEFFPLGFETANERTEYIRDHADFYVVTWRQNYKNMRFHYSTLDRARINAQVAADFLRKPILIYAVLCPFSGPSEPYGYDSWIESVHPHKGFSNENRIYRHSERYDRLSKE